MWIVCDIGFFNIVCQDDDLERGLLTIKARSRRDLEEFCERFGGGDSNNIEESQTTDYRFRVKAKKKHVSDAVKWIVDHIDYPKTKPKLAERHPDRQMIHFRVWEELYTIQVIDETKA